MLQRICYLSHNNELLLLQLMWDDVIYDATSALELVSDKNSNLSVDIVTYDGSIYPAYSLEGVPLQLLDESKYPRDIIPEDSASPDAIEIMLSTNQHFSAITKLPPPSYKQFIQRYLDETKARNTGIIKDSIYPTSINTNTKWNNEVQTVELRKASLLKDTDKGFTLDDVYPVVTYTYDRNADCLHIPRNVKAPIYETYDVLCKIFLTDGIPFDKKKFLNLSRSIDQRKACIAKQVQDFFKVDYIDMEDNLYTDNNRFVLLFKYLYGAENYERELIPYTKNYTDHSNVSITKEGMKTLISTLEIEVKKPENCRSVKRITKATEILKLYVEYSTLAYKSNLVPGILEQLDLATPSETTNGVYYLHPEGRISDRTCRYITAGPNIQGWVTEFKECLGGENDWDVISLDIVSQDAVMLVMGVLQNPKLKQALFAGKKIYEALAEAADIPYTQEVKGIIKIPTLALMNGQSTSAIYSEVPAQYHNLAGTMINLIKNDPGYAEVYRRAVAESKSPNPCVRGLFGMCNPIKDAYKLTSWKIRNKVLSGNFQGTSLEVIALCFSAFIRDLIEDTCAISGVNYTNCKPFLTIHDELCLHVHKSVTEKAKEAVQWYMLPKIEGWARLQGSLTVGDHYVAKG